MLGYSVKGIGVKGIGSQRYRKMGISQRYRSTRVSHENVDIYFLCANKEKVNENASTKKVSRVASVLTADLQWCFGSLISNVH